MKKTIIIVDDKVTIAKIIAAYLSNEYNFEYFNNPIPCLERLAAGPNPDLIISDILMPIMRGDIFLDRLKGNEQLKDIPVIMLSSEDSSSERIRLLQNGAEDYIVKPFNPLELKIRIKKILE
ncbi:MAG: response regulator [Mucinivorans sp.]